MKVLEPRPDFVIVEDYFDASQAAEWLALVLDLGRDPQRGFLHPDLKSNRFHRAPKYPVKKYMCFGLFWNPFDYRYTPVLPGTQLAPFPVPKALAELGTGILKNYLPWEGFRAESVLVNFYTEGSSMGLHVDRDEEERRAPVIGLNFGSSCRFFFEDEHKQIKDVKLPGNSVYVFGGRARDMKHGLGTIYAKTLSPGSEKFLKNKERLNLTIRQVRIHNKEE
ncbi:MAG TPA: alpha-ketoglutarate-dependent dioxygenase AlkB [Bacteriovoracaceae bacterium]|nr:alpha-ketoglutarate-dependent dioxygenase AlkB [Bacteriovoracaceae bacterium]